MESGQVGLKKAALPTATASVVSSWIRVGPPAQLIKLRIDQ